MGIPKITASDRRNLRGPVTTNDNDMEPVVPYPESVAGLVGPQGKILPNKLTPVNVLKLQRTIGNQAVNRLLAERRNSVSAATQSPVQRQTIATTPPIIQRGIVKADGTTLYKQVPNSFNKTILKPAVKARLKRMIMNDERTLGGGHYTLFQAIQKASKTPHYVTGRAGRRLNSLKELRKFIKHKDHILHSTGGIKKKRTNNTSVLKDKFNRVGGAYEPFLKRLEIMESDFSSIPHGIAAKSVYKHFTNILVNVTTQNILTMKGFNKLVAESVSGNPNAGASIKGSMFEQWSLNKVLNLPQNRERFLKTKSNKLEANRNSDGYDATTQTLWDMKHYEHKMAVATNKNQAADYDKIIQQKIKSTNGNNATNVNYLFPTEDAAKLNEWLNTIYGFGVYYVDKTTNLVKYK